MSRINNADTPTNRRNLSLARGRRRLTYSPSTPMPTPRQTRAPMPTPRQRRSLTPEHVVGDRNAPLRASYTINNSRYNVHGDAEFNPPEDDDDSIIFTDHAAEQARQRAVNLHESLTTTPRSPDYSPVHSPSGQVIDSDDYNSDDDERMLEQILLESAEPPQTPQPAPEPQEDVEVLCHICSCTFTDIKNYNSNFVTSSECNHAVCFKCYVSIVFNKEAYKCSICNRTTLTCRAYNRAGYVELSTVRTVRDNKLIKQHWMQLTESNMPHNRDKTIIEELQLELADLRATTARAHHEVNMIKSDNLLLQQQVDFKNLELQQELNAKVKLQKQNDTLSAANTFLQNQLDAQVAESKIKMDQFVRQHEAFLKKFKSSVM
ncbi:IE2 [Hyphantria cunea nucleopolyhedrovirus]|uniref:E3 ubiquitin-protein ligase IE2 n=2 Tax=Hyphantria cunea nuclear polyhedrosis virus TaxID=28288 RepID=VIE2_NPVHC|nr:IE2 [Hyphantria cunea nucleopolyhedrovirus]Q2NNU1.1 RecName: Full=E3 ubiquitin-protein ligase IE2; AltName: Full=Immediate-early protein IE2; AltName: Full=RING-type E3 ubiquitin transferase IE2 [Hyphantria cunea nucleopolyhedrovirus]BAE72295.1 IE2 [Hyphantria cunea nucleopolyhedrovirus]